MRPVQAYPKASLDECRAMKPDRIVRFLDDFRRLQRRQAPPKSRLISLKVPEPLLDAFKEKADAAGVRDQSQIKRLMQDWLQR